MEKYDNTKEKIYHIGVLIGNAGTEHPRELITGIYDCVREENAEITLFLGSQGHALDFWKQSSETTSTTYNYQYNCLYDYALLGQMDALVIAFGTISIFFKNEEQDSFLDKFKDIPTVVLEHVEDDTSNTYLMSDNYSGMEAVIEHLVAVHGYKKILLLSGPNNSMEAQLRKKAYYDVMARHNITVLDSMIVEGDFTPMVESQIEQLLDTNPNAEAIACANDEMANAAYNVCRRRGITVGKDLAITGYDDVDLGSRLDPPLTTSNQDGLTMGYESIKAAIDICRTGQGKSRIIPAPLIVRGSCGCDYHFIKVDSQLIDAFHSINSLDDADNIHNTVLVALNLAKRNRNVPSVYQKSFIDAFKNLLIFIIKIRNGEISGQDRDYIRQFVLNEARQLFNSNYEEFIIHFNLSKTLNLVRMLLDHEIADASEYDKVVAYNRVGANLSAYIESLVAHYDAEKTENLIQSNKAISFAIQIMMENSNNDEAFYLHIMQLIKERNVGNAFLYLNTEPIHLAKDQATFCPNEMILAAQMINGSIKVMSSENIIINKSCGFSAFYPNDGKRHHYSAFLLFQEELQYGLLVCETSYNELDDISCMALQISTALSYKHLRAKEEASRKQLYDALNELEEKNKVLSIISSNDQLTNLYNRRGFMEQMFSMLHKYEGRQAYLFFFDLDHLKEINDVFGHTEGDYAITSSAYLLKSLFDNEGIIARLGGDEYVGVLLQDDSTPQLGDDIVSKLKGLTDNFNSISSKPYYIELSAGYTHFTFDDSLDIKRILTEADTILYEAKTKRRKTVCKNA